MRQTVAVTFLCLVFGAMGALCVWWGVVSLIRGAYPSALVVSGFAVFCVGMIAMMTIVSTENVTARVEHDEAGTTLRPDRRVDGLLTAATMGAFGALVLFAILTPLGMMQIPLPPGNRQYFVVAAIVGAVLGLRSVRQIAVHRGMSSLRMTVEGLELGTSTSTVERQWKDVSSVADTLPDGRRPINGGTTYITTTDGRTRALASDWYTPGGQALRALVLLYWQHPELRAELTDGRAAERLAMGQ